MDRSQLTRLVVSGGVRPVGRPMAYKRPADRRWLLLLAVTLSVLALVIGLNLAGLIH